MDVPSIFMFPIFLIDFPMHFPIGIHFARRPVVSYFTFTPVRPSPAAVVYIVAPARFGFRVPGGWTVVVGRFEWEKHGKNHDKRI